MRIVFVILLYGLLFPTIVSCTGQKDSIMTNKTPDVQTANGRQIISAPVVTKNFVKKNGEVTERTELYLQRSIQDYFIKFCESNITREVLEDHLSKIDGPIKTVTVEVEFREGAWDQCDEEQAVQSRIGEYAVIYRIISWRTIVNKVFLSTE